MSSSSSHPQEHNDVSTQNIPNPHSAPTDPYKKHLPLYKAALTGDWETAKRIFEEDTDSITARITVGLRTPLHVAVGACKAIHFVEKLVEMLEPDALALPSQDGDTALHHAAMVGNTKAAVILVRKNPTLPNIMGDYGNYPVQVASLAAHRDTLSYLLSVTRDTVDSNNPFANQSGAQLLVNIIVSGFLDMALNLVRRYPYMATLKTVDGDSPLRAITRKVSAFPSGSGLNFWQRFIYSRVPVSLENYANNPNRSDVENPPAKSQVLMNIQSGLVFQKLQIMFWQVSELLVPCIKRIREKKVTHNQAIQLVNRLCLQIASVEDEHFDLSLYTIPMFEAARLDVHEVVEEIVDAYPAALWYHDSENRHIFHIAIQHRCENVFNLMYRMSERKNYLTQHVYHTFKDTILHSAGYLAPPHKLSLVPGAALQMQRELQWFKEVEKFVNPAFKEKEDSSRRTPGMLFSENHKDLVIEGGKWMKDTANSCTIAAALIATVVFAAAITVPGGNQQDSGLPMFSGEIVFIIFAVSDSVSLFTSTTSLFMFLSILTSRYAEVDFLYVLPMRLIIGLVTLFISITSMMITFSATLYLVFFKNNNACVLIPIATLACLPVTLFVSLQFPLLVDVISSTYRPGIFGKQSDRPFV